MDKLLLNLKRKIKRFFNGYNTYIVKIEYGMGGYDNYIGYWLVVARNKEGALRRAEFALMDNKNYSAGIRARDELWAYTNIKISGATDMVENFGMISSRELAYDNYN